VRNSTIFFCYLPNIINKTSTPIIFADDTSILFAQSNLTDLNKNIHNVFETLNKCFGTNQLSLNFNKTHYIQFATKRNISTDLKIGYNNNFITSTSYTKFLGLTMDKTLSWNNHIELLIKKLSMACYIIRSTKAYVCLVNKINLLCLFSLGNELNTLCGQNVELLNVKLVVHIVTTGL
jgi:hypothetical protein